MSHNILAFSVLPPLSLSHSDRMHYRGKTSHVEQMPQCPIKNMPLKKFDPFPCKTKYIYSRYFSLFYSECVTRRKNVPPFIYFEQRAQIFVQHWSLYYKGAHLLLYILTKSKGNSPIIDTEAHLRQRSTPEACS